MEMVAMDMKLRGMYMARQLSFSGVKFSIQEVELAPVFVQAYNASVELVRSIALTTKHLHVSNHANINHKP